MDEKQSTILLVDDDIMNLKILSSVLEEKYNLLIVRGGKKALDIIEEGNLPDLILLDIMMPDLDGYSVCTLLKSEETTKDIPVIFISAMGQSVDEHEGLSLGAVDYIKKPFVPSIVLTRVETQLKLSNSLKELKNLYSKSEIMNRLVKYKNHQIEMILDNSGEGYLVLDTDLIVQSEHSKECDKIFGFEISGKSVTEIFSGFSGFDQKVDEDVLKELFHLCNRELQERSEVYLELLPNELEKSGKIYNVRYSMIMTENIGKRLLVVLKDITEKKRLQQRLDDERQNLRMIVNIVSNVENYKALLRNAKLFFGTTIYEKIKKGKYAALLDLYIKTHTFKGVFGQLNLMDVYDLLERLENLLSAHHADLSNTDLQKLLNDVKNLDILNGLEAMNQKVEDYIGFEMLTDDCYNKHIVVNQTNLEKIKDSIRNDSSIKGKDIVCAQLEKIKFKSLCAILQKYCDYSKKLSIDLGKEKVITEITGEDVFLDPLRYGHLMDSLVHIFRNIVDHGIEKPEERYRKNKKLAGKINCDIQLKNNEILLTVSDDGKGIDFDHLKKRIKEFKGFSDETLESFSEETLIETLFEERFSSIEEDNGFSGCGMGLSAVKSALDEIEGSIHIDSEKEKGTCFTIRFRVKGDEYNR